MVIKTIKFLIVMIFIFLSTGCWDYIGVDKITIVTGIAIDINEKMDEYKLSFEVINASSSSRQQNEIKTEILESTGSTMFDAVRNAKKRIRNKLYFSDAQVVIISNQIAREKGINSVIDFYLRDAEIRETLVFTVSKEETAKELLQKNGMNNPITAFEIEEIIEKDNLVVSTTKYSRLYEVFNSLNCEGTSVTLPILHNVKNDDKQVVESSGIAVFNKDKLINYLTSKESKGYLFVDDNVDGGILTLDMNNDKNDDISIEISDSSTTKSFSYDNNKYKFDIKVEIDGLLGEMGGKYKEVNSKKVNEIAKATAKKVKKDIKKIVDKAKNEFKVDIFSFGNLIYKTDPKLWKKIKKDWETLFLDAEFNIKVKVNILNTAFMK